MKIFHLLCLMAAVTSGQEIFLESTKEAAASNDDTAAKNDDTKTDDTAKGD
jgi:hypothetical protein